jgi:ribonuclease P protein component
MKRFQSSDEIKKIWKKVSPCKTHGFLVRIQPSTHNFHQIAVIIPKKKVKQAVVRNRIRRCVKEAFIRLYQAEEPYQMSVKYDILVVLCEDMGEHSTKSYQQIFHSCWHERIK